MGDSFRSLPADLVAEIQQHFGDAAHADASDSGEMKMLGSKKHFLIVLFRLSEQLSIENLQSGPCDLL